MRDVTPQPDGNSVDFNHLFQYLIGFVKNPIEKIRVLPNWNWTSLFVFHIVLAVVSGILAGLLKLNALRMAAGLFIMPVVSTVSALLLTLFLYYYFQFFEKKTESYRRLFTLVVLASVPFYLFQILAEHLSFISIIGFAMTSMLGIVGLTENFGVEKKRAGIVVGGLFLLVLATWIKTAVS